MREFSASETRLLRFLKAGGCEMQESVRESHVLLVGGQGNIAARRAEIDALCRQGVLVADGPTLALRDKAARSSTPQRPASRTARLDTGTGETVEVNLAESPLAALYRRRGAGGESFISDDEFYAGERLRADFTRGCLMPSITSRWDMGGGRRAKGSPGGTGELTEFALASRLRVERALEAVGPELSGVLVDVCCFLKGLETVERERRWPVRSAKMLLKAGLAMLHRHYNPPRRNEGGRSAILHWGADGYRPRINSAG